ncbi:alpha-L-fucosidase [Paraglaciecola sp. L3A3]|uniref:alpha-L-fucosidase n=1 Tax=Paraglaciecola sp. L3A3 TaxID=2686358 RepID=UPI00131B77DC|nr:alpha-L-fucosidase [Paraglaciecola sp. L3A3]
MKKLAIAITAALLSSSVLAADKADKSMDDLWGDNSVIQKQISGERGAWFKEDKYSMFVHWGLYSMTGGEWNGKTYYGIAEWLMSPHMADIPKEEYKKLAAKFNPTDFDAKAWVKLAVDSGMKNIVITAKHHDGFAMYDSAASDYDVIDASPYKRDPMKELAEECQKAGIGLGFYYSQNQDWYEQGSARTSWTAEDQTNSFEDYFNNKVVPQVTELLSNYGPISTVWFDTPGQMSKAHSMRLVELTQQLQPNALINSRIGNGVGDFKTLGDHHISDINHTGLWETIDTTNSSWSYAWYDENWKTSKKIVESLITTVGRGGSYMLNVGPDGQGNIPQKAQQNLLAAGEWVKENGVAIYGADASPWGRIQPWGDISVKGNKLYLHVTEWPKEDEIYLSGLKNNVVSVELLNPIETGFFDGLFGDDNGVSYEKSNSGWTVFNLPKDQPKELSTTIVVELDGEPQVDDTIGIDPIQSTYLSSVFSKCNSGCKNGQSRWMEKFGEWKYAENIMNWDNTGKATWSVDVAKAGEYILDVEYSADDTVDFSEWYFTIGGKDYAMQAIDSGNRHNSKRQMGGRTLLRFHTATLALVDMPAGKQEIVVRPKSEVTGGGILLRSISFRPVK